MPTSPLVSDCPSDHGGCGALEQKPCVYTTGAKKGQPRPASLGPHVLRIGIVLGLDRAAPAPPVTPPTSKPRMAVGGCPRALDNG